MTYISGGFDLRVPIESVGDDAVLDEQFLVPELRNRVSTDPLVWPRPKEVSEIHASEVRSFPLGVPSGLGEIVTVLYERGMPGIMVTPVALVVSDITVAELCRGGWVSHFENARQQDDLSREGWHYVGFDVTELNGLCSGLKGCGYKQPLWSELRGRFGRRLNQFGLFEDAREASEFAHIRGREIPAHAPFEVVGILVRRPVELPKSRYRGDSGERCGVTNLLQ